MAPKDYLGSDQRKVADDKAKKEDDIKVLDAGDIHLLKTYGQVFSQNDLFTIQKSWLNFLLIYSKC